MAVPPGTKYDARHSSDKTAFYDERQSGSARTAATAGWDAADASAFNGRCDGWGVEGALIMCRAERTTQPLDEIERTLFRPIQ
ncbi:MAG TPA: hypothetical protein VF898_10250 [Chloroflexota bacterium]